MAEENNYLKGIAGALSADGTIGQLEFVRADSTRAFVQFPMVASGRVIVSFHRAIASLFEKQKDLIRGQDPRQFFQMGVIRLSSIQGATAEGRPILSFVTDDGVRLDFAIPQENTKGLSEWLAGLAEEAGKPSPPRN